MLEIALAALAGVVAFGAWRLAAGYPAPRAGFERLWRHEIAFVEAAAQALFPPGGAVRPSGLEAGIPRYVDRYLGQVPGHLRFLMRCLFLLFEHGTLGVRAPGARGWRRFSALSHDQRVAVLERWRRSPWIPARLVFTSLRAILTLGYFASPAVLRELRLAPYAIETPVCEADLLYPPIGRGPEAIRYTRADLTPPSAGHPLDLDGPLHPDYAEAR